MDRRHPLLRTLLLALLLAFVSTMAQAGPFTNKGTQPGISYGLNVPSDCALCHANYDPREVIEPTDTYAGSLMAQAARDPLFWATLDVANNDIPDVGDFCLRCHVPRGWLEGRSEPPGGSTDGCGFIGRMDERDNDLEGINCHFCHRMMINPDPPPGEDPVYYENGQFWIDDSDCGGLGEPCRHGPYDYPGGHDPLPPPHNWAYSAYHESSGFCGNCHNVTHPAFTLIENGSDTGVPFPIERTYREWLLSDYSNVVSPDHATCQECHMPDATSDPAYACNAGVNNRTGDMAMHHFAGGNVWIPDVLRQEYPNLSLETQFLTTIALAYDMLQNQSAVVELTAPAMVPDGGTMPLSVMVTNLTGHKLPTGYPEGRRMWLNVQVHDGLGGLVWESGAYDPITGVLTEDAQAKVYEAKPGIFNYNGTNECDCVDGGGSPIFHFALNNCFVKDNRIPPLGFTGGTDLEVQPVGYSYPETSPGSGILVNYDTTDYTVAVPPGTVGPLSITSTLRYQTTSKEYVEFLLNEAVTNSFPPDCIERTDGFPTESRAQILHDMWNTYDKCPPVDMTSDTASTSIASGCTTTEIDLGSMACADTLTATGNTAGATNECGNDSGDAFYGFTVTEEGFYTVSLCSAVTTFDSVLRLYDDACCGNEIDFNDDACGTQSELSAVLSPGTYHVHVEGYTTAEGPFELTITCTGNPCAGNETDLGTVTCPADVSATGDTTGAANVCGNTAGDAFYVFTVPTSDYYTISTCYAGTTFDTYLRLYDDYCCVTEIAANDDFCDLQSQIDIVLAPGTYRLQVEGYSGFEGAYEVHISCTVPPPGDLSCSDSGSGVDLIWNNNASYDSIEVMVDGVVHDTLAGTDTTYTATGLAKGYHCFAVCGVLNGTPICSTDCCLIVGYDESVLLWDFEADDGGFVAQGTTSWQWGAVTGGCATTGSAWGTTLAGDYGINECSVLDSPSVDLGPKGGYITVDHCYDIEADYDGATVWFSADGVNFTQLAPLAGYDGVTDNTYGGTCQWVYPLEAFHGDSGGWVTDTWDLTGAGWIGQSVNIRFAFGSDDTITAEGWAIDNITVYRNTGTPEGTVGCDYSITPASGTVPFQIQHAVTLTNNYAGQIRRIAGRLDVSLGGGTSVSNWRSGYTNIAALGSHVTTFNVSIPAYGSVIGDNTFTLVAEDITPAPYNQPPYPASGDTCTDVRTVTAYAP